MSQLKYNFKIISLNINGLNSDKLQLLRDQAEATDAKIICLQETHAKTDSKLQELATYLDNYVILSSKTADATKGTALLYKQQGMFFQHCLLKEIPNRAQLVQLAKKNDFKVDILNVFAPNTTSQHENFIEELCELSWSSENRIVLGDFNFDAEKNNYPNKAKKKLWDKFFSVSEIKEISNVSLESTWISGNKKSRIDRLNSSNSISPHLAYETEHKFFLAFNQAPD